MTSFADPGYSPSSGDDSRDVQVNLNADVSGYTTQVSAAQQATMGLSTSVDKLGASLGSLSKFVGRQLFHFAAADFAGLSAAVADAASLEHQMGTLRATAMVTGTSMAALSQGMDKVFATFPVARREVVQLAQTIQSLGVTSPVAISRATATFTKLGGATGQDPNALAAGTLQLNRVMGNTQTDQTSQTDQISKYANALTVLSAKNGVAVTGILEFSQAIAPMARAAGIGEAAVLGISTAFSKAGADGAYAANTFNKIITDINTMKQTGDPAIAKYASFLGQSAGQFRAQTTATNATQLFDQLGKGGPEALNFASSLGLGPRDLKAVQAVAQGGGLGAQIAQAQGNVSGTKDLDSAAKAAFSGLSDSVIEVGNAFTKLGEIIGAPFLKPLTMAAETLGTIVGLLNKTLSAMGPIPGMVAAVAGALAIPAGLLLTHFGLTSALAVGRSVVRGPTMSALREGRTAGAAVRGGMTEAEAMAAGTIGSRVAAGEAGFAQRAAYNMGMARGQRDPGMGNLLGRGIRGGVGGLLGAGTWALNMSGFRRPGEENPGFRESVRSGTVGGFARAGFRMGTSTMREGALGATELGAAAVRWGPGRLPVAGPAVGAAASGAGMLARGAGALAGLAGNPLTLIAGLIAVPLISGLVSQLKQGDAKRKDLTESLTGSSVYDQGLDKASTNLDRFSSAVDDAATRLSKFSNTPIGQLGQVTGEDLNAVQGDNYKVDDPKLKPLIDAAKASAAGPGGDPKAVEKAVGAYLDAQAVESGPVTGDRFKKMQQDALYLMGTTPESISQNQSIFTDFGKRQSSLPQGGVVTPDFGNLASLAAGAGYDPQHPFDDKTGDFKDIFGAAVSGLSTGTQNSGDAGVKSKFVNLLSMSAKGTAGTSNAQGDRMQLVDDYLQKYLGIDPKEMANQVTQASKELGTQVIGKRSAAGGRAIGPPIVEAPYASESDAARVTALAASRTTTGQMLMKRYNISSPEQLLSMMQNPGSLPPLAASGTVTTLRKEGGALGNWAAGNAQFMAAAVGGDSGKPGPGYAAAMKLATQATTQAGGDFGQAATALQKLTDVMGGASTTTGALIAQAQQWTETLESFRLPTLSRAQQYSELSATARRDSAAGNAPNASPEAQKKGQAAVGAVMNYQEGLRQNAISQIKEVTAFDTSRDRAADANKTAIARSNRDFTTSQQRADAENARSRQHAIDDFATSQQRSLDAYHLSVRNSEEDFNTSQLRSQEDYYKSAARAQEDYQLGAQRSLEDYQKNVSRQNEDHARDLSRQAQTAAQSIYDPYIRVQKKATTDAGTLIYNLKEQNADIQRQIDEIAKLKKQGLSQQSIDTLDLSNPENAQQVSALTQSFGQNPNMIGQVNAQVNQRLASTQQLTQSNDNMGFRNSQEDFRRSMSRASEDFSTTQRRAAQDQSKSMSRMATDFETTTKRAAADQAKSLKRMGEAFHIQQQQAADDQAKALKRMAEAFSITKQQAVDDHKKALGDMATDYKKAQKQAAQDLATSLKEYTGDFNTVMGQLSTLALGKLKTYAPAAAAIITQAIKDIQAAMPKPIDAVIGTSKPGSNPGQLGPNYGIPQGPNPLNPGQSAPPAPAAAPPKPPAAPSTTYHPGGGGSVGGRFAFGGISMTRQMAEVSEHGPELHLPLNSHGEDFMAGLIAKSLTQGVTTAISGGPVGATSVSNDNSISFSGAEIQVVAQDPNQMARELAAKAKLRRLASPVRH